MPNQRQLGGGGGGGGGVAIAEDVLAGLLSLEEGRSSQLKHSGL